MTSQYLKNLFKFVFLASLITTLTSCAESGQLAISFDSTANPNATSDSDQVTPVACQSGQTCPTSNSSTLSTRSGALTSGTKIIVAMGGVIEYDQEKCSLNGVKKISSSNGKTVALWSLNVSNDLNSKFISSENPNPLKSLLVSQRSELLIGLSSKNELELSFPENGTFSISSSLNCNPKLSLQKIVVAKISEKGQPEYELFTFALDNNLKEIDSSDSSQAQFMNSAGEKLSLSVKKQVLYSDKVLKSLQIKIN